MTRPTVRIGGEIQGVGGMSAIQTPDWIAEGAIAAWDLQEASGTFEDAGANLWDLPHQGTPIKHNLLSGKVQRRLLGTTSATYADARINGEMSICCIMSSTGAVGVGGLYCYVTAAANALWGIGQNGANVSPVFFDQRHGGTVYPDNNTGMTAGTQPFLLFATRSATGVVKLYLDGALSKTTAPAADPAIAGTEALVLSATAMFDHIGLWDSELSEAEVIRLTKITKPWLNI